MGLTDIIEETGHLPRDQFIQLLQDADILLAINSSDWSTIIPGKIYEYWAVGGAPILLLTSPGAAESLVTGHDLGSVVRPDDTEAIERAVSTVYQKWEEGKPVTISTAGIERYDRRALTEDLAHVLEAVSVTEESR
jgi:glycosyltransferase involved in cell wall biosynthesis